MAGFFRPKLIVLWHHRRNPLSVCPTNMKVLVHVKEKCIPVSVGDGDQPVRWLANVGIARHDDHQGLTLGLPVGVKAEDGSLLNMDSTLVGAQIADMQHVWVTFKGAALPSEFGAPIN